MRIVNLLFVALLLSTFVTGCAKIEKKSDSAAIMLPAGTLDAASVKALFSGYTVESKLDSSGRVSQTYYNPDGRLRQLQDGAKRDGAWKVRDDGRICLQFGNEREKCRIIVKEGETYVKYLVKKNNMHERVLSYTAFRKGNLVD